MRIAIASASSFVPRLRKMAGRAISVSFLNQAGASGAGLQ
jgi:hypothetical protein